MTTICIDCRYVSARPSGIAQVVMGLVDHLPSLAPEWRFVLLKRAGLTMRLSGEPNVTEVAIKAAANTPATMWWLPRLVDMSEFDLFHATFNIMPAHLPVPCIVTIHDVMWLTNPQWCNARFSRPLEGAFYRHGIGRALRSAAAITTVSEASRAEICAYAPAVAPHVHVTVPGVSLPNPSELQTFTAREALHPMARAGRFVLTVGQYAPYKNHDGALRIFARAFAHDKETHLVLVQRLTKGAAHLGALARALGIAERVHFMEELAGAELALLYSRAAALLHPSFCEGFGLPLGEAMVAGCPVVSSDRSAMPEVLGGAAMLADPNDEAAMAAALRHVVENAETATRMRHLGRQRAQLFSWDRFAQQTLTAYEHALSRERSSPK